MVQAPNIMGEQWAKLLLVKLENMAKGLVHLNVIVLKCVPSWYAFQEKDKRALRDDSGYTQSAKANCLTLKFFLHQNSA